MVVNRSFLVMSTFQFKTLCLVSSRYLWCYLYILLYVASPSELSFATSLCIATNRLRNADTVGSDRMYYMHAFSSVAVLLSPLIETVLIFMIFWYFAEYKSGMVVLNEDTPYDSRNTNVRRCMFFIKLNRFYPPVGF